MFFNWEPLELPENGSYMVVSLGPANNFTGKVLDSLEFGSVLMLACVTHNNISELFLVYSQLPLLRTLWGPRVSVLISESP